VLNAINDYIKEACAKAGISTEHVYKIVVVGNTCMHHIFLGVDVTYVGLAPYAPVVSDLLVYPARELPLKAAPNAQVCLLPIVAGFVGADTMACVLATRIYESKEIRALVDIGTNGEVVMGSKGKLYACSGARPDRRSKARRSGTACAARSARSKRSPSATMSRAR
jgi:uncharacterized 2Fe-2S/4Fe-4S cluster protein (DUF4445 family)